jgi:hypothetical protein
MPVEVTLDEGCVDGDRDPAGVTDPSSVTVAPGARAGAMAGAATLVAEEDGGRLGAACAGVVSGAAEEVDAVGPVAVPDVAGPGAVGAADGPDGVLPPPERTVR